MTKEQLAQFWLDFHIPTQQDDTDFPFANPSDAARSLIKSRNWVGLLTEELLSLSEKLNSHKKQVLYFEKEIAKKERENLALGLSKDKAPGWISKNKEIQKAFIYSSITEEEKKTLLHWEIKADDCRADATEIQHQMDGINMLLRIIDKSTEWVIQYINWAKFEVRSSD
jgi:hypothetical protein